jgi:hypothetical protein
MHRAIVWALGGPLTAGLLAGCSSMPSLGLSSAPPPATTVQLQLDSRPAGATATLSDGTSCKTPCALPVTPQAGQSVTFAADKHLPQTVALQVTQHPGQADFLGNAPTLTDIDPNPVFAELQAAKPARKARKPVAKRPAAAAAAPAPAATAEVPATTAEAPPAAAASPFPPPPQAH